MLSYSTAQKEEVDQSGHHGQGNSRRRKVPNELFSNCGLLGGAGLSGLQDEPNLTGFSRTSRAKAHCLASSFAALEALRHWSRWSSLERLAALVPRPRLHLIRFHGVLAPNAKLRRQIVPAPAERAAALPTDHASAQGDTPRMSCARLLKRVFDIDVEHCPNCGGALKIIAAPSSGSGQGSKIRR